MIRTALLVITDSQTDGMQQADYQQSIKVIRQILQAGPFNEIDYQTVSKQPAAIRSKLRVWTDVRPVDLVLTTGGTDFSPFNRTFEATHEVLERELPGVIQLMQLAAMNKDRHAALLRMACGVRKQTLLLNLPDKAEHVQAAFATVAKVLPEAITSLVTQVHVSDGSQQNPFTTMWG